MGMRAAAATSGLGLKKNIIGLRRVFSCRSSTYADIAMHSGTKYESESRGLTKNIQLRFLELEHSHSQRHGKRIGVVRPIILDLRSIKDETSEELLSEAHSRDFWSRPMEHNVPQSQAGRRYLAMLKHEEALKQFRSALFGFYHDQSNKFSFVPNWRHPFPSPPFLLRKCCDFGAAVLDGGKKVLAWEIDKPGLVCYDFARHLQNDRYKSWTRVSSSLADKLPLIKFRGKWPFFIDDHDPDIGQFHLMFNYENEPPSLSAYFVSNKFDNFVINKPFQLPELCYEYLTDGGCADFEFVYLEERKFSLVLNKYYQDRNAGSILLLVYEYDLIKPTSEIQTRLLMTRRFQYHTSLQQEKLKYKEAYPYNGIQFISKERRESDADAMYKDGQNEFEFGYNLAFCTSQVELNAAFIE